MKIINTLFAFGLIICLTSCGSDSETVLNYDGANFSAPEIIEGTHEAAARFIPAVTSSLVDREIEAVDFYLKDLPNGCEVRIYGEGTALEPGDLLYSEDVSSSVSGDSWNTHTLSTPISIGSEDIWVSIRLVHNSALETIGCDQGPADSNGDFLWGTIDDQWITFRDRTSGATDINWNIRAIISE